MMLFRANIPATIFAGLAAVFAIVAVAQSVSLNGFLWFHGVRDKLEVAKTELGKCVIGRKQDRETYEQGQRDAADLNRAQVERIESEQQRITSDVQSSLSARLERLRRELRAQNPAAQSPASGAETGPIPGPAGSADAAPRLCLAPEELLRGAEAEERYDQLISWIERQLNVKR